MTKAIHKAVLVLAAAMTALCPESAQADTVPADTAKPVRIVLIGDSHIQADVATGEARRILQSRRGAAGRGLTAPLKLIGSNQPQDYSFSSPTKGWRGARLMKEPHAVPVTWTGVGAQPPAGDSEITVALHSGPAAVPFDSVILYYEGPRPEITNRPGASGPEGTLSFPLDGETLSTTLRMHTAGTTRIGGVRLLRRNAPPGSVELTAVGNNGAAFGSYAGTGIAEAVASMDPDLIVVALGTNDAWGGGLPEHRFLADIDTLVGQLKRANPGARLMLTTPIEAQKKTVVASKGKAGGKGRGRSRKGSKSKRRARTVFTPETKVGRFASLIAGYARKNGIALCDLYTQAGGAGSSRRWTAQGLFSPDRVHLSEAGYLRMGRILAEALDAEVEAVIRARREAAAAGQGETTATDMPSPRD